MEPETLSNYNGKSVFKQIYMGNLVAIVGRPNVGKSTLFNRLTNTKSAIVHDVEGTTRDRQYGKAEWNGVEFSVVDTGGWIDNSDDVFETQIKKQVRSAIDEADAILFLVDVKSGLTDYDMDAAKVLRQYQNKIPVLLIANKADTFDWTYEASAFYSLGLGEPYALSAANGSGTGDFLDKLLNKLPKREEELLEDLPKVAIVGRPNAGKSSMINAFFEEDKSIVTEIAGTTRDSIYTRFNKFGFDYYLIDTAGIRKKGKVNENLEYYSVLRSIKSIESSDVCVLMLDATRGIESQDLNIFSLIQRNRKGLVVCVNKWDLVEDKSNKSVKAFEDAVRRRFAPFVDFPIIFTSAISKQRVYKVLQKVKDVYDSRRQIISTNALNNFMLPLISAYPPPSTKGKYIRIKYITQLKGTHCPGFVFFANLPQYVKEPYKRFLENKLRSNWNFEGTPLMIFIRKK